MVDNNQKKCNIYVYIYYRLKVGGVEIMKLAMTVILMLVTLMSWSISGWCEERTIPEEVPKDHWSRAEIMKLGAKFQAGGTVPDQQEMSRREEAAALLTILEKVIQKCETEGPEAMTSEDRERLSALHHALHDELASFDAYTTVRETIEKILAPLEEATYLFKVGVSGFLRGEGSGNFTYSLSGSSYTPGSGVGRMAYRIMPYLEWNPTDYLEMKVQGQGYGFTLGSPRDSQYALYQAYLDLDLPDTKRVSLKLGQQEFVYGSAFILGANGFYNGLTFDAARLRLLPLPGLTAELLGGYYAAPNNHYFKNYLAGAYLTYPLGEGTGIEAYYFHDQAPIFTSSAEHLDTFGARGTARFGPAALEFEPVYETGQRTNPSTGTLDTISAWGGHVDLSLDAEIGGFKNTFICGYAYGSGSQDAADGRSLREEFSNANNNTSLTGDLGLIGDLSGVTTTGGVHASGLQIATAGWGINLLKELNFTVTGHYFRANDTPQGMSRNLGLETDFILTWNINDDTALIVAYDRFFTGGFFREATGSNSDIEYGYVMLQFNLYAGKKKPGTVAKSTP
jgi:hypothetical protein